MTRKFRSIGGIARVLRDPARARIVSEERARNLREVAVLVWRQLALVTHPADDEENLPLVDDIVGLLIERAAGRHPGVVVLPAPLAIRLARLSPEARIELRRAGGAPVDRVALALSSEALALSGGPSRDELKLHDVQRLQDAVLTGLRAYLESPDCQARRGDRYQGDGFEWEDVDLEFLELGRWGLTRRIVVEGQLVFHPGEEPELWVEEGRECDSRQFDPASWVVAWAFPYRLRRRVPWWELLRRRLPMRWRLTRLIRLGGKPRRGVRLRGVDVVELVGALREQDAAADPTST